MNVILLPVFTWILTSAGDIDTDALPTPFETVTNSTRLQFTPTRPYVAHHKLKLTKLPGDLTFGIKGEYGYITTRSGKRIDAFRNTNGFPVLHFTPVEGVRRTFATFKEACEKLPIKDGHIIPDYDCHGLAFARAQVWIDDKNVKFILKEYEECEESQAQVVLYFKSQDVVHSSVRIMIERQPWFLSKAGEKHVNIYPSAKEACQLEFDETKFYKLKPSKGQPLSGV
jgi:hypothetical protein